MVVALGIVVIVVWKQEQLYKRSVVGGSNNGSIMSTINRRIAVACGSNSSDSDVRKVAVVGTK